jgi:hypothetical protein
MAHRGREAPGRRSDDAGGVERSEILDVDRHSRSKLH